MWLPRLCVLLIAIPVAIVHSEDSLQLPDLKLLLDVIDNYVSILYGNPDATTIDRFVEILVEHKHSVEFDIVDVHGHVWTNMLALHRYLTTNENKQYLIQLARSKDALQEIEHLEKKLAEVKVDNLQANLENLLEKMESLSARDPDNHRLFLTLMLQCRMLNIKKLNVNLVTLRDVSSEYVQIRNHHFTQPQYYSSFMPILNSYLTELTKHYADINECLDKESSERCENILEYGRNELILSAKFKKSASDVKARNNFIAHIHKSLDSFGQSVSMSNYPNMDQLLDLYVMIIVSFHLNMDAERKMSIVSVDGKKQKGLVELAKLINEGLAKLDGAKQREMKMTFDACQLALLLFAHAKPKADIMDKIKLLATAVKEASKTTFLTVTLQQILSTASYGNVLKSTDLNNLLANYKNTVTLMDSHIYPGTHAKSIDQVLQANTIQFYNTIGRRFMGTKTSDLIKTHLLLVWNLLYPMRNVNGQTQIYKTNQVTTQDILTLQTIFDSAETASILNEELLIMKNSWEIRAIYERVGQFWTDQDVIYEGDEKGPASRREYIATVGVALVKYLASKKTSDLPANVKPTTNVFFTVSMQAGFSRIDVQNGALGKVVQMAKNTMQIYNAIDTKASNDKRNIDLLLTQAQLDVFKLKPGKNKDAVEEQQRIAFKTFLIKKMYYDLDVSTLSLITSTKTVMHTTLAAIAKYAAKSTKFVEIRDILASFDLYVPEDSVEFAYRRDVAVELFHLQSDVFDEVKLAEGLQRLLALITQQSEHKDEIHVDSIKHPSSLYLTGLHNWWQQHTKLISAAIAKHKLPNMSALPALAAHVTSVYVNVLTSREKGQDWNHIIKQKFDHLKNTTTDADRQLTDLYIVTCEFIDQQYNTMEIDLRLKIIKYKHALGGRLPKHSYIFGIDRSARSNNQDLIVPHDVLVSHLNEVKHQCDVLMKQKNEIIEYNKWNEFLAEMSMMHQASETSIVELLNHNNKELNVKLVEMDMAVYAANMQNIGMNIPPIVLVFARNLQHGSTRKNLELELNVNKLTGPTNKLFDHWPDHIKHVQAELDKEHSSVIPYFGLSDDNTKQVINDVNKKLRKLASIIHAMMNGLDDSTILADV